MKKHKFVMGAILFILVAPFLISIIAALNEGVSPLSGWSVGRLRSLMRTILYGGAVSFLTTMIGWWIGWHIALFYREARVVALVALGFIGVPPFIYTFLAMDAAGLILGAPFLSGYWVSVLVSVFYWLPLSISLWTLFTMAIPAVFYDEPRLSVDNKKAMKLVGFKLMKEPAKTIFFLLLLLCFNDYSIPSIFAYNTYPIEIMTIFSMSSSIARPVYASLPLVLISAVLVLMILRSWQQMPLDLTQSDHPLMEGRVLWLVMILGVLYIAIPISLVLSSVAGQLGTFYLSRSFIRDVYFSYGATTLSAFLMVILAYFLSYFCLRYSLYRKVIFTVLVVILCMPGTLVGITVNHFYGWLEGTVGIDLMMGVIPMVHMLLIRFCAVAFMVLWFGMSQVSRDHFDLALTHSDSLWTLLIRVLWPFVKSYVIGAFLLVAMLSLGELSGTIMVVPPGRSTLAVTIYNYLHYGSGDVVAMLVGGMFLTYLLVILVISLWIRRAVGKERE